MSICEDDPVKCPIFGGLTDAELNRVLRMSSVRAFHVGESIIRQGCEYSHGIWMVQKGHCEAVYEKDNGIEEQIAVMHSGDIFGEVSFFIHEPHTATIRALSDCGLRFIPAAELENLATEDLPTAHKLVMNISRSLSWKLKSMDQLMLGLSRGQL